MHKNFASEKDPEHAPVPFISVKGNSSSHALQMNSPVLLHHQLEKLKYEIHAWSSHSAQYHPKNILEDKPQDQASRWSSGNTITFGKYHKVHVCNLKEFKIYGGPSLDQMVELLHSGLRNDSESETFALKYKTKGVIFPCKYIKIVPLMAWGANFNYSIWYVELRGVQDQQTVQQAFQSFQQSRETEAIRLCLKYFRQHQLLNTFSSLQNASSITLEDPLLTQLHQSLVLNGDFEHAQQLIKEASDRQYFHSYIEECPYKTKWKRLHATDANGESPCKRGGHQMCIDPETAKIYLFGGWDGTKDLADFWVYSIESEQWFNISLDTRKQGGPAPRSCHKICMDPKTKQIYVLGRYIDPQNRPGLQCDADFFRYDTLNQKWTKLCSHTASVGGPELIYDHQMNIDSDQQILYVFGGRIIHSPAQNNANENAYSGLYAYHIPSDTWKHLRADNVLPQHGKGVPLKSRIGHSMLLNQKTQQLYIFAGQRQKDYLSDYYIYDIPSDTVYEMNRDSSKNGGPDPGFTQRATIDTDLGEFYVFSGLMRDKNSSTDFVRNSFWVYQIGKDQWQKVYQNENQGDTYWKQMAESEPCPRFAHQLVYDHLQKVQYLFGGNPGEPTNMTLRLDDFWSLRLVKPETNDLMRKCQFLIRKQKFKEMCLDKNRHLDALKYLQTQVSQLVRHDEEQESLEFRNLTTYLFSNSHLGEDVFQSRTELYEQLLTYFPADKKQPTLNLVDLIPF